MSEDVLPLPCSLRPDPQPLTRDQAKAAVEAWRAKHPSIHNAWVEAMEAAVPTGLYLSRSVYESMPGDLPEWDSPHDSDWLSNIGRFTKS